MFRAIVDREYSCLYLKLDRHIIWYESIAFESILLMCIGVTSFLLLFD